MSKVFNTEYNARLPSIDLLRGFVLIIMALDHARDYFGFTTFDPTDLSQTTPLLFLTRWITNISAPAFFFLAGISAFLYGKYYSRQKLSSFLFIRGLWLIFLEITIISFGWNLFLDKFTILQVIFALGFSMIILAGLVKTPRSLILVLSLIVILGHNYLDRFTFDSKLFSFLHNIGYFHLGNWTIYSIYPIIPWFAVMSLGYCFGPLFELPVKDRAKSFLFYGCLSLGLFVGLRYFNFYGDSLHWDKQLTGFYSFFSFINISKYPPSLHYLLLTLSMCFFLLPILEHWKSKSSHFVLCFGKVPLFFYIIHLYILSIIATLYSHYFYQSDVGWWWGTRPWIKASTPATYHFNLGLVYFVWIGLMVITYPLCKKYERYKSTHNYKWLKYL